MVALWLVLGVVLGAAGMGAAMWLMMPKLMINVRRSQFDFAKTVEALTQSVTENGWEVQGTYDVSGFVTAAGEASAGRVTVLKIAKAPYAAKVLSDKQQLSVMMPCSIGVYEAADGGVYISQMNTGLMGRMFGGKVAEVLAGPVATDEGLMCKGIVRQ